MEKSRASPQHLSMKFIVKVLACMAQTQTYLWPFSKWFQLQMSCQSFDLSIMSLPICPLSSLSQPPVYHLLHCPPTVTLFSTEGKTPLRVLITRVPESQQEGIICVKDKRTRSCNVGWLCNSYVPHEKVE